MKKKNFLFSESARMFPALPLINRECSKPYQIPGTSIVLQKGTAVKIQIYSLHQDEKYFPNPDKFDPSRFFEENRIGKSFAEMPFAEMLKRENPFGIGPRYLL